jgi:CRISPR-associated exonuclease Cas4
LTGIADLVEEQNGEIYPVEYKKGRRGDWKNDQLQLCAQALCLEEMLNLTQPIKKGYIYYAATGRRKEVALTDELRTYTLKTIEATRKLLETQKRPDVAYGPRCRGCSLYPICLSREVQIIQRTLEMS